MKDTQLKTNLEQKAQEIRKWALKAITKAQSGHPGGSLSIAEILSVLYFGDILKHNPQNPKDPNRDHLIVSKGHSSPAVYAALGLAEYFSLEDFVNTFRQTGTLFQGHIDSTRVSGIEMSTGSLGQGQSMANGFALAARQLKKNSHIFCLLSDGELQEGQSWEALMAASHFKLGNLTSIIDRNRLQLDGTTEQTMALEPLADKLIAFGWQVQELDGHSVSELHAHLAAAKLRDPQSKPLMLIAHTVKGKGVSFMENQVKWHGVAPKPEELALALAELQR